MLTTNSLALMKQLRIAMLRLTPQSPHQIQHMSPQNPQVLSTTPTILLAASPNLQHLSNLPTLDQPPNPVKLRRPSTDVRHSQFQMPHLTRTNHLVRLTQGATERLFHVHVTARCRTRQHHVPVLINPPRTNRSDLRSLTIQQLPIIRIRPRSTRAFPSLLPPRLVRISHRHHFTVRKIPPDRIQTVAIIPATRTPQNRHTKLSHHPQPPPKSHGKSSPKNLSHRPPSES